MICVIAGNYQEAERWARSQDLTQYEWFYPEDEEDLLSRAGFHVIVVGTAGMNVPASYFNHIYNLAQQRGRMK